MSEEIIAQNTDSESTTSQDLETSQEVNSGAETDITAPQDSENPAETSAQSGENNTAENETEEPTVSFLEIQYNHEKKGLSREEAAGLAQKGIYYESAYNAIERVAMLKGLSVEEFLSKIEKAEDEAYRQSLIERFGGDEEAVASMMELHEIKKQQTLDGAKEKRQREAEQAEQSANQRIAEEFTAMKTDFPELTDFASMPDSVKKAASEGMPLAYAYLLHKHTENKKIAASKQNSEEAAKKSTGSMSSRENPDFLGDAFLRGISGKN